MAKRKNTTLGATMQRTLPDGTIERRNFNDAVLKASRVARKQLTDLGWEVASASAPIGVTETPKATKGKKQQEQEPETV